MIRSHYLVEPAGITIGESATEVYNVRESLSGRVSQVWRYADGTCRCTRCSGPLVAMLTTCAHATALRRHFDKQATSNAQRAEEHAMPGDRP